MGDSEADVDVDTDKEVETGVDGDEEVELSFSWISTVAFLKETLQLKDCYNLNSKNLNMLLLKVFGSQNVKDLNILLRAARPSLKSLQ